jgi:hypothetical protein
MEIAVWRRTWFGLNDAGVESVEVIKGPASLLYGSDAWVVFCILIGEICRCEYF